MILGILSNKLGVVRVIGSRGACNEANKTLKLNKQTKLEY